MSIFFLLNMHNGASGWSPICANFHGSFSLYVKIKQKFQIRLITGLGLLVYGAPIMMLKIWSTCVLRRVKRALALALGPPPMINTLPWRKKVSPHRFVERRQGIGHGCAFGGAATGSVLIPIAVVQRIRRQEDLTLHHRVQPLVV